MMRRGARCAAVVCAVCVAGIAAAHGIDLLVLPEGNHVRGKVTHSDGKPVAGVTVEVRNETGETLGTVPADVEGEFAYEIPRDTDLVFVVETDDGHRAEAVFEHDRPGKVVQSSAAHDHDHEDADIQGIVQRELIPLREQLDAYQHQIRVHDVLGGFGYVVGVVGLIAWWKARRQTP